MLSSVWLPSLILLPVLTSSHAASILTPPGNHSSSSVQRRDSGSYVQAGYFTNWGIYGNNFQPTDIDPTHLTHIMYAFANVSPTTGEVFLTDAWADEEKPFPGDPTNDSGNNLYGCLGQLYQLKLAHRNLKVLLSVGGWTYSQDGDFSFLTNGSLRASFVSSAVQLVNNYGLDGIDIDFEYPANEDQGQGLLDLMTSLRSAFDQLAIANGDSTPYELTLAVAAEYDDETYIPIQQMNQVLTYWNLMAYDYSGSWSTIADDQANLYGGSRTGVSTDSAINRYISSGATLGKINMGIPLYGRSFEKTEGIGQPYDGVGPATYDYKDLPLAGAQVYEDWTDVASYSYDAAKEELVSYDTPDVVRVKAEYVVSHALAGCMFWELSGDKTGSDSLVQTAGVTLAQLDQTLNHIHYPNSKWDNVRNNMGEGSATAAPSPSSTFASAWPTSALATNTASTLTPTPSTPAYSCTCEDVSPWNDTAMYVGGDETTYAGYLWTAMWWTENDVPGGAAGVWEKDGACD